MTLFTAVSALALRSIVDAACEAFEKHTGLSVKDHSGRVVAGLVDHFKEHGRELGRALDEANDRTWRTIEIALAGESLATLLDKSDDKAFRAEIRASLDANPALEIVGEDDHFRRACLKELRDARRRGLLTGSGGFDSNFVFAEASEFARYDNPALLVDAEWAALGRVADGLRTTHPRLASLLETRGGDGRSPLVTACRYFFNRAVQKDESLFRQVVWGGVDRIGEAQSRGFDLVNDRLDQLLPLLDEIRDVVVETRSDVLDIKLEQARQGDQAGEIHRDVIRILQRIDRLDQRSLKLVDSLSIRGEDERRLVKALVQRYRALPDVQCEKLPALLNSLAELEFAAGEPEEAHAHFNEVASLVHDPLAKGEALHNAYLAALETRRWDEAFDRLKRAITLDSTRFSPFPANYEAEKILGAGGFGVALLCRHRHLKTRRVVIKALRSEDLERDLDVVFEEAHTINALRHPGIIGLIDCGFVNPISRSHPHLILDYFDGVNLADHVRDHGPISADDLIEVARQVAEALAAAHKEGIWHRDVKPENLLLRRVDKSWEVKVIDFGLALRRSAVERSIQAQGGRSLVDSSIVGTLDYAAPEQLGKVRGVSHGPYSDVYGFGKTCYFALFKTPNPRFRDINGLPDPLKDLLTRCVDEEHSERPQGFEEVLRALAPTPPAQKVAVADQPMAVPPAVPKPKPPIVGGREEVSDVVEPAREEKRPVVRRRKQESKTKPAIDVDLDDVPEILKELLWTDTPRKEHRRPGDARIQPDLPVPADPLVSDELSDVVRELMDVIGTPKERTRRREARGDASSPSPTKATRPVPTPAASVPGTQPAPFSIVKNSLGIPMVLIPPGEFEMGADDSDGLAGPEEKPQHKKRIAHEFWLGQVPVTQRAYQSLMGNNPSNFKDKPNHPVESVSWYDAIKFCNALSRKEGLPEYYSIRGRKVSIADSDGSGYRLPTEAEWEYAARGGTNSRYWFGDKSKGLPDHAWFADNSGDNRIDSEALWKELDDWDAYSKIILNNRCMTKPVGTRGENPFKLHDMLGNVWEWCWDGFEASCYERLNYEDLMDSGPVSDRVLRGGSWDIDASFLRVTYRFGIDSASRSFNVGFRVCRTSDS